MAKEAKIPRASVYDYFADIDEVVAALVEREAPAWCLELKTAVDDAPRSAGGKVEAFVTTQLRMVAHGRHRLGYALGSERLSQDLAARIAGIHEAINQPLRDALVGWGVSPTETAVEFVGSVVRSAGFRIHAGAPVSRTINDAVRFVIGGLRALKS